jgi:pimeloyl-ACP methyl ester carboxylesterase
MRISWDKTTWSKSPDQPTMLTKHLVHIRGWRLDLHKMIGTDAQDCLHTHPARALRLILWGGYVEEFIGENGLRLFREWRPFRAGIVKPELAHRITSLRNKRFSYSLWLRAPSCAEIHLVGDGWSPQ